MLLPRPRPCRGPAPGRNHSLPALPPHTHPPALTDHHADPVVLQPKAERWFLGAISHRLLRAGGLPPLAASAAPTAPTASSPSSIRLLRGPPFRSLGPCRASRRSNDPGGGVGTGSRPRHGAAKGTLHRRRRSRPARTSRPCRRAADLPGRPRSRYLRSPREARPALAPALVASHPLVGETWWAGHSRLDQSALFNRVSETSVRMNPCASAVCSL